MANMKFDVKCVKECLINAGRVFTVRAWRGYAVESFVDVEGVGKCKKIRIGEVSSKNDLASYVNLSGFGSVDEWWQKVQSFGAQKGFLFLVVRL